MRLRIATRKSQLALWQAEHVKAQLTVQHPQLMVELVPMTSRGDQLLDSPLSKLGGKGLFVKELEQALLEDRADIAVHSMKDVPMSLPPGLTLTTICQREDPRDALVSEHYRQLQYLPQGARVGTSSLRRQAQLLAHRPDLDIAFLRGNVNTRLAKLESGAYDAIILAAAGLRRLGLAARIGACLAPEDCLPAAGQGAIGIECREDDTQTQRLVAPLNHKATAQCVTAERALTQLLDGSCQVPMGAYACLVENAHGKNSLWLRGLVASTDGQQLMRHEHRSAPEDGLAIGTEVGRQLLAAGAGALLQTHG